jgi:hypothetical protein
MYIIYRSVKNLPVVVKHIDTLLTELNDWQRIQSTNKTKKWSYNIVLHQNSIHFYSLAEAVSPSDVEELGRLFWRPEVHRHLRKISLLVPILSHLNPVHAFIFYF